MEKIHVLVDSASDLSHEYSEELGIEVLPVMVTCGDRSFREYEDITPEEFWDLLETSDVPVTTAQITPTQFIDSFTRAKEQGCTHVLCVLISTTGSGTYSSGVMARDMFYEEHGRDMWIELIDTRLYSAGISYPARIAAEMAAKGRAFDEILQTVKGYVSRTEAVLAVQTLKYMKRSARISGMSAFVGELLGLKPIAIGRNGEVKVIDKVRGEKAIIPRFMEQVRTRYRPEFEKRIFILHGKVEKKLIEELMTALYTLSPDTVVERIKLNCSITTNTGPNMIGVLYYTDPF